MSIIRFFLMLTAIVILSLSPISAKDNKINWTPEKLTHSAVIGTSSSVQTSFISPTKLSNIRVRVVPELASYVSVSPEYFSTIPAGERQNIRITFNTPEGTSVQTLSGTIHLVAGSGNSKTYPHTLPIALNIIDAATFEIPAEIALPSADRIITEPGLDGNEFVKDEIVIFFKENTQKISIINLVLQIGGRILGSLPEEHLYQVQVSQEGFDNLSNIIDKVNQDPNVELAIHHTFSNVSSTTPNDLGFAFSNGANLINLPAAWDITTGSNTVKIGVVDNVFDNNHEDLIGNIAKPALNSAGVSNAHGTHVAGIIAAEGNNTKGIAGTMWDASLYLYSTVSPIDSSQINLDSILVIKRMGEAIRDKVQVLNYSAGDFCPSFTVKCNEFLNEKDLLFARYLETANKQNPGMLWVIAAGNGDENTGYQGVNLSRSSPARLSAIYPNVISVSAVDNQKKIAGFSHYGQDVTVAAPGVNILSLMPGNFLTESSGTSQATPYVTGVAGLMLSKNGNLTGTQIKSIIKCTAEDTGNRDPEGNSVRLLNAYRAVQTASTGNDCSTGTGTVNVGMTVNGFLNLSGQISYDIVGPNGVINGRGVPSQRLNLPSGQYTLIYRSGGPANSVLTNIAPTATQTLNAGGTISFTMNFVTQPFQWLSFTEGNPGIPGDGSFVDAAGGLYSLTFEEINPVISLAGTTDGISIAVFPKAGVPQPYQIQVGYRKIGEPLGTPCSFSISGGEVIRNVVFNGIQGSISYRSQQDLLSGIQSVNNSTPSCNLTIDNLTVTSLTAVNSSTSPYITILDAASIGRGPNSFPGTLIP